MNTHTRFLTVLSIAVIATTALVPSTSLATLVTIAGVTGSNGGDRYGTGMPAMIDGSGMDTTADPEDPSEWLCVADHYNQEWMGWFFKDGDGEVVTGDNSKLAWAAFDLGASTSLENMYLWNNRYQSGISGVQEYNLYYADSPTVALPAMPAKNQFSDTGLDPAGDYVFSSGGWTLLNEGGMLTVPKAGDRVVDLSGVTARYIAVEIISNWGDTYKKGRVGLNEVAFTATSYDPTDIDQDGDSDLTDLNALTGAANLPSGVPAALAGPEYDINGDETVNSADLETWLTDAATINGFGSAYLKGDTNIDGDVDVWAFDGSGDAQVLSSNLGTMTGMVWGDGDFNGDGDVDVWAFDGSGDAQELSSNLGSTNDAAAGTAEAFYNRMTGELSFDIGSGVGVVGIMADGMMHGAVNEGSIFGAPGQNGNNILAYFNTSGLPTGMDSVGIVLPTGLTQGDLSFSYTPVGGATTVVPVMIVPIPEPSTMAMLAIAGLIGLFRRRRRA